MAHGTSEDYWSTLNFWREGQHPTLLYFIRYILIFADVEIYILCRILDVLNIIKHYLLLDMELDHISARSQYMGYTPLHSESPFYSENPDTLIVWYITLNMKQEWNTTRPPITVLIPFLSFRLSQFKSNGYIFQLQILMKK